jgi:hypothetical protein|tara:strand:+ start:1179 stop:1406 length:228 start_codon:yes stop_codon:yes gene_type:complete
MPTDIALKYIESANILEAQETLLQLSVLDYQKNMKQDDRKKFHKQIKKQASAHQKTNAKSVDDLESLVKGILRGR